MAHQFYFGAGNIYVLPAGATPIQVAAIQNVSVDFDGDAKALYGQLQFPLDTARGKIKVTGKFDVGQVNLGLWNAVFFGANLAGGQTLFAFNEPAAVPGSSPYTITVANAAHFTQDLGVYYAAGATTGAPGTPLTQVTSVTAVGQYSVNPATGVYTFYNGDASAPVLINYEYSQAATGPYGQSQSLALTNQLMGAIPVFGLHLNNNSKGKQSVLQLYACTSSKLQFPFKQDDYAMQSIDFAAQDDGTGRILNWSVTQG